MSDNNGSIKVPVELLRKYDRPGPRYTSYPTAPVWSDKVISENYAAALKTASKQTDQPLAAYVHIPFCRRRCYYCGCNTYITKSSDRVKKYIDALITEIKLTAELLGGRKKISQLHFGGGTPTYVEIDDFNRILGALEENFEFIPGCEKSLEIDPRVTTFEQLDYLAGRGFNRISVGVQDVDPTVQEAIGRIQSFELVSEVVEYCRQLKFKGINIDLIYGLPKQTIERFDGSLLKAVQLKPDRVALYSFAYLPDAKANQKKISPDDLPATEIKYRLFADAVKIFTGHGYRQIGMDHFALPEDELSIAQEDGRLYRNFMGYTVQSSPDMIGLGMSSIGYINHSFFQNHSSLDAYMNVIGEERLATYRGMILSYDDLIRQNVIMSLMCNFRLDFNDLKEKFGIDYHTYFTDEHQKLAEFFTDDFLEMHNGGIKVTPVGRTFIRNIAMTYDNYLGGRLPGKKPTFSRTI
ncbi:MAG: oxygen-independent coproporphyrinogen III oxidase [candidate division Zixibacteria bacterium HGW-Zixibacteria-1]|nr:MAG: oxygen-independent coproporphyrinogen III oxidase [candidate division Zixibacteria bacterium HGW-Zixibacteria-1]